MRMLHLSAALAAAALALVATSGLSTGPPTSAFSTEQGIITAAASEVAALGTFADFSAISMIGGEQGGIKPEQGDGGIIASNPIISDPGSSNLKPEGYFKPEQGDGGIIAAIKYTEGIDTSIDRQLLGGFGGIVA